MDNQIEKIRMCCGVKPEIVIEYSRNSKYKMRGLRCHKCGMRTGAKRFFADAVREWDNPETVHVN